ncbi:MAG: hypothetical protein KY476_16435 [Planctomycetes bacterium]|nr:hypothetical protein [Planctomycetota bacterium]
MAALRVGRAASNLLTRTCVVSTLALLAFGCGEAEESRYSGPGGTVTGKVTYKGETVQPGSTVSFINDSGLAASGTVVTGGTYTLSTSEGNQIPVGTYKASVVPPPQKELTPEEAMQQAMKSQGPGAQPPETAGGIPVKFANPETSGLLYEVKEGENTINIEIPAGS